MQNNNWLKKDGIDIDLYSEVSYTRQSLLHLILPGVLQVKSYALKCLNFAVCGYWPGCKFWSSFNMIFVRVIVGICIMSMGMLTPSFLLPSFGLFLLLPIFLTLWLNTDDLLSIKLVTLEDVQNAAMQIFHRKAG